MFCIVCILKYRFHWRFGKEPQQFRASNGLFWYIRGKDSSSFRGPTCSAWRLCDSHCTFVNFWARSNGDFKNFREPYGSLCSSIYRCCFIYFLYNWWDWAVAIPVHSSPISRNIQGPWSTMMKWRQAVLEDAKRAQKWGSPMRFIPFDPKKSAGKKHEKPTVNMMENPISFVVKSSINGHVQQLC